MEYYCFAMRLSTQKPDSVFRNDFIQWLMQSMLHDLPLKSCS